ncbi:T9SS type A sorting domain-containing protein [Flammeovirga sp. MY04]|uniref:T9SS type A sorting domain-containing protein n=1 Tax=Flammeovirga sp. MY04 TaxID=1191459 RepID=UPI0013053CD3|nr:T9SS type A sorting domain-containing protein [Flammeovirga sp. MY04]ANQ52652.2 T9SS type A sorting domain-containing protein [Flammeovirga sp. MY04]
MKNLILLSLFVFVSLAGCTSSNEENNLGFEAIESSNLKKEFIFDEVIDYDLIDADIKIRGANITFRGKNIINSKIQIKNDGSFTFDNEEITIKGNLFQMNANGLICFTDKNITLKTDYETITHKSEWCYHKADLPVTMIFFKSSKQGNNIQLKWATATEENSDFFEVQRSFDMINWETIDRVKAAGNSNTRKDYSFLDDKIPEVSRVVYHRLKQVDLDGASMFYGPVAVKMGSTEEEVTIYPNPVAFGKNLKVVSTYDHMKVRIFDVSGRTYYNETILSNLTSIPMNYGKGVLFVEVQNGAVKTTKKIIVH